MAVDLEKLSSMADDTVRHKKIVMDNCLLMSKYLMLNGKIKLGTDLLKRGCEHDNSKFDQEEFIKLSRILKSRKCFTDAKTQLSKEEKEAIQYHWEHNKHHPEYFETADDMTELDILEMICDWFARSIQYKTEFIPFIKERQTNRFNFSKNKFEIILGYCYKIEELYNKEKRYNEVQNEV